MKIDDESSMSGRLFEIELGYSKVTLW